MPYLNETRVRLATPEESIARARRCGSAGQWLVERLYQGFKPMWNEISAHLTEEAADAAKAKLDRKIAKGSK